jgi:hypothetical protein
LLKTIALREQIGGGNGGGRIGQVAPDALRRRRAILPTQCLRHQRIVAILSGKLIPKRTLADSGRSALSSTS